MKLFIISLISWLLLSVNQVEAVNFPQLQEKYSDNKHISISRLNENTIHVWGKEKPASFITKTPLHLAFDSVYYGKDEDIERFNDQMNNPKITRKAISPVQVMKFDGQNLIIIINGALTPDEEDFLSQALDNIVITNLAIIYYYPSLKILKIDSPTGEVEIL